MNLDQKLIDFSFFIKSLKDAGKNNNIQIDSLIKHFADSFPDSEKINLETLNSKINDLDTEEFYSNIDTSDLYSFRHQLLYSSIETNINYFTITSHDDFTELPAGQFTKNWGTTIAYTPLNDHSRVYLNRGDILFCYRQGQFSSLSEALDTRGIYGIGVAVSEPFEMFPEKEKHNKWAILVTFPLQLPYHLELRNIQMHPQTIDLTPYNGNRNDALQYIAEERHYASLLDMLYSRNIDSKEAFISLIKSHNFSQIKLPSIYLNSIYHIKMKSNSFPGQLLVDEFIKSIYEINLKISNRLIYGYISSLLTKPFVILTGLSGSGKTKLAETFSYWITELYSENQFSCKIKIGDIIGSNRVNYKVIATDTISVTMEQVDSGTRVTLPYELIIEWIDTIKKNNFNIETPPRAIREAVNEITKYSTQLSSFETHLKAIAFFLINKPVSKNKIPNRICLIPVGADWTNREPLLGYPNALETGKYVKPDNGVLDLLIDANNNPDLPFFLILDEMNLSHVERYFADFLSTMESGEPIPLHSDKNGMKADDGSVIPFEIKIPDNLFIIGTVNIDETTYMFSPKVLDRANVIEFRVTEDELNTFLDNPVKPDLNSIRGAGAGMASDFLRIAREEITEFEDKDEIKKELLKFFKELKKTGAEFGYRTSFEIFRFAGIVKKLTASDGNPWTTNKIIDAAVLQKLLPKLHGSRKKLDPVLKTLALLCLNDDIEDPVKLIEKFEKDPELIDSETGIRYKSSLEKIIRMKRRADQDGFTSFAEA